MFVINHAVVIQPVYAAFSSLRISKEDRFAVTSGCDLQLAKYTISFYVLFPFNLFGLASI